MSCQYSLNEQRRFSVTVIARLTYFQLSLIDFVELINARINYFPG